MTSDPTRRTFLALIAAAGFARPAAALTDAQARDLIGRVVGDINAIISSGASERAMLDRFAELFRRYGDVPAISRATLGADARRATPAQLSAFSDAFGGYISRKYGRRFREMIGGKIEVVGAQKVGQYWEVISVARLAGQAPFEVRFRVSDRSGRNLFFDIVIEGISLGKTERSEIGALLDRNRGDIDRMIAELRTRG